MTTREATLANVTQSGALLVALNQIDAVVDPVEVTVYYTDGSGQELSAGKVIAPAPGPVNAPGRRAVAIASVPGATGFRVVATNDLSLEAIGLSLKYGRLDNVDLASGVTLIQHNSLRAPMPANPKANRSLTAPSDKGALLAGLLQADFPVDPVDLQIWYADSSGVEYLAGQMTVDAAPDGPSDRAAMFASVPGVVTYRVKADNGASAETVDVSLKHGELANIALGSLTGAVTVPPSFNPGGQPETLIWLATNGNDTTGRRGRIDLPFATLAAAIAASQNGDSIMVTPGTYNGAAVVPADRDGLSIKGTVPEQCTLQSAAGTALTWEPGGAYVLTLENLRFLTGGGATHGARIEQTAGNNAAKLVARNSHFGAAGASGLMVRRIDRAEIYECTGDEFTVDDVNTALIRSPGANLVLDVTPTPPPTVNHFGYNIEGGIYDRTTLAMCSITHRGVASVSCDSEVKCALYDATAITNAGISAAIQFAGLAQVMNISVPNVTILDGWIYLDRSEIDSLSIIYSGAAAPLNISARNANIPGLINMLSTGGQALTLDCRGGYCDPASAVFGVDCYLDRDQGCGGNFVLVGAGLTNLLFGVDIGEPPFPPTATVNYIPISIAGPAALADLPYTAANDNDQANIGSTNAVTVNLSWMRRTS